MSKKNQHVSRGINGKWAVRDSGSDKANKVFETKDEAIKFARTIARDAHTGVFIHAQDGRIVERTHYDSKSSSPRDKH